MMSAATCYIFVPFLIIISVVPCFSSIKYVDLSHPLNAKSTTWPPNPRFEFTIMFRGIFFDNVWLENNKYCTPEHVGTHMDAPAHFSKGEWRVHQIPLERLIGPGVVIDIKKKASMNVDYRLSIEDLEEWEKKYGKIKKRSIVMMNSGWGKNQGDDQKAWGTTNITDTTSYHFPGWHEDAVLWLVKNRDINMIGVDVPSIDYGQSQKFRAHVAAATNTISMIENVANLDLIPPSGSVIYAAPIKIENGSGGQARVFASIETETSGSVCLKTTWMLLIIAICVIVFLKY